MCLAAAKAAKITAAVLLVVFVYYLVAASVCDFPIKYVWALESKFSLDGLTRGYLNLHPPLCWCLCVSIKKHTFFLSSTYYIPKEELYKSIMVVLHFFQGACMQRGKNWIANTSKLTQATPASRGYLFISKQRGFLSLRDSVQSCFCWMFPILFIRGAWVLPSIFKYFFPSQHNFSIICRLIPKSMDFKKPDSRYSVTCTIL